MFSCILLHGSRISPQESSLERRASKQNSRRGLACIRMHLRCVHKLCGGRMQITYPTSHSLKFYLKSCCRMAWQHLVLTGSLSFSRGFSRLTSFERFATSCTFFTPSFRVLRKRSGQLSSHLSQLGAC